MVSMVSAWLVFLTFLLPCEWALCSNNKTTSTPPIVDEAPSSFLLQLWDSTASVIEAPWVDPEAASRQGAGGGVLRITLGVFLTGLAAAVLGVVGVGGVGLLAAKALSVGLLALLLAGMATLKQLHHKHDSGGEQTVHYVPVHHQSHHDVFHDRNDYPSRYLMDRSI